RGLTAAGAVGEGEQATRPLRLGGAECEARDVRGPYHVPRQVERVFGPRHRLQCQHPPSHQASRKCAKLSIVRCQGAAEANTNSRTAQESGGEADRALNEIGRDVETQPSPRLLPGDTLTDPHVNWIERRRGSVA